MEVCTAQDAGDMARQAAERVVAAAQQAIAARGKFCFALSGGSTPWQMFGLLVDAGLPWQHIHIFQVDERVAPDGDAARNFTHMRSHLLDRVGIPPENIHAMPVTASDLEDAARRYAAELQALAGEPAVLDLVHLGMGGDGHTASLLPGDAALDENAADVALSGVYQGHVRMTLTYPAINRARQVLWLISGQDKAPMLARLLAADTAIPAGGVRQDRAVIVTDIAANADDAYS